MEERSLRIIQEAVGLAEKGGFDAVRLRDLAARSGVALGTVYSRFASKEAILVAALDLEVGDEQTGGACQCESGYDGVACQIDIDDCAGRAA